MSNLLQYFNIWDFENHVFSLYKKWVQIDWYYTYYDDNMHMIDLRLFDK